VASSPQKQIRSIGVLIVEPIGIVRSSLRMVFDAEPDFEVLGETGRTENGVELARRLTRHTEAVVLIGLEFVGDRDSSWFIRTIRTEFPSLMVLATGTDLNRGAVSRALFMGADGFIHKNSEPDRFVEAARRAAAGELVLPEGDLAPVLARLERARTVPGGNVLDRLTSRETEILRSLASGDSPAEIADALGISALTVQSHVKSILAKLDVHSKIEAITLAWRHGLAASPRSA
jgi:DNA-binding NarL/FixJ family response regulator